MGMSRIARVFLLFVTVIVIGASGYKILGGEEWSFLDSIYMAVITLSTTGVVEVRELTPSAKIWTIILISFGIGIVFYAFSQATELILNINLLRRNKMEKRASKLKNHFIVCGYGRMGTFGKGVTIRGIVDRLVERRATFGKRVHRRVTFAN